MARRWSGGPEKPLSINSALGVTMGTGKFLLIAAANMRVELGKKGSRPSWGALGMLKTDLGTSGTAGVNSEPPVEEVVPAGVPVAAKEVVADQPPSRTSASDAGNQLRKEGYNF